MIELGFSAEDGGRVSPRRATHFLLLRQKKVSKEKATPLRVTPCFARGNLRCSRFAGSARTRFAQTAGSPDPRNAPLLGTRRGGGGQPLLRSATANTKQPEQPEQPEQPTQPKQSEQSEHPIENNQFRQLLWNRKRWSSPDRQREAPGVRMLICEEASCGASYPVCLYSAVAERSKGRPRAPSARAEERSFWRIRAACCLSEASSGGPRET